MFGYCLFTALLMPTSLLWDLCYCLPCRKLLMMLRMWVLSIFRSWYVSAAAFSVSEMFPVVISQLNYALFVCQWDCWMLFIVYMFQDAKLRGRAYVAMGRIGKRLPRLFSADIGLVQSLFNAVAQVNKCWIYAKLLKIKVKVVKLVIALRARIRVKSSSALQSQN